MKNTVATHKTVQHSQTGSLFLVRHALSRKAVTQRIKQMKIITLYPQKMKHT